MNAKISVLVICDEAIIYLLLFNLHDCTFKGVTSKEKIVLDFFLIHLCFTGSTFTSQKLREVNETLRLIHVGLLWAKKEVREKVNNTCQ